MKRSTVAFVLLFLSAASLMGQGKAQVITDPEATLRIYGRAVVVDVVVTDKSGRAVPGLRKEDFEVSENGKRQEIDFFEPHFLIGPGEVTTALPLPSNTFTNIPAAPPNNVTNVLLLDALNTRPVDRMYAQARMVKYLASVPPNLRMGIFTLTDVNDEKLNLIWGFDQDSSALGAAIARFSSERSPASLIPTPAQQQAQQEALPARVDEMKQAAKGTKDTRLAGSADALQGFLKHGTGISDKFDHLVPTLSALQALAHYLAGVPGRKNLFWLVHDFPVCNPDPGCGGTMEMLAEAGVSVYPIDARGVDADIDPLAPKRFIDTEIWAEETGGKAYHANDIKQEIADAVDHGSRYYTLAYVPSDRKEEGREHKIEVKVLSGNYTIFNRKGYFEQTHREIAKAGAAPAKSPLIQLMGRGMPNISEISYRLKVVPSATQPEAGTPRAGGNAQLSGRLTRYNISFQLQASGLSLVPDADGVRRKPLEVILMVYSQDAKPLNWESRNIRLLIKPEQWATEQRAGIPFHLEIDAPAGDVYLRTGVFDASTSRAGTLEIPLTSITVAQR